MMCSARSPISIEKTYTYRPCGEKSSEETKLQSNKPLARFGYTIQMLRCSKQLSQEELAGKIPLEKTILDEIEKGAASAEQVIVNLENIANALGVKPRNLAITLLAFGVGDN